MNEDQLFQFYEKLYFQELDRREKLSARLNVPLAVLVAAIGFLSFMLNNAPSNLDSPAKIAFWCLFISSCLTLAIGSWFFKSSWFGHTDKLLPTANETETYRETLIDLYKEYDEKDSLVEGALKKYLYDYYKQFSSENTINNDARAYHLYRATSAITVAVLLAFVAFIPYFLVKPEGVKNDKQAATTSATTSSEKREGERSKVNSAASTKPESETKPLKSDPIADGASRAPSLGSPSRTTSIVPLPRK